MSRSSLGEWEESNAGSRNTKYEKSEVLWGKKILISYQRLKQKRGTSFIFKNL